MLYRLTMLVCEATLCAFKVVDTTRRKLRQDYPALHGTSAAHDWRDAER